MNTGDKVILKRGWGYADITNGIESFHRSTMNIKGTVRHFVNYVEIYVDLLDGRYIKTGYDSLEEIKW